MGQEFVIKSTAIEDKINQLLPSQGGFEPGVDFSASTTVIPIVDLTETAEGSALRQDLQTASSFNTTAFAVNNTTTTVISTTGYYKVIGVSTIVTSTSADSENSLIINDGTSDKTIWAHRILSSSSNLQGTSVNVEQIVFLPAGHSLKIKSVNAPSDIVGSVRQIADISGNLVNP